MRSIPRWLVLALVAVLAGCVAYVLWPKGKTITVDAVFGRVVGLYQGDDVRVLGVPIGHVAAIDPRADGVHVRLALDADQKVPAEAQAVVIAPSLVSIRYIQLTPAYTGGPELADGAVIPQARTAVPVEWDEVKRELTTLATDLGPDGANSDGALNRFLDTTAANLDGKGGDLHDTISQLSQAMTTLANGRGDLFATVRNLQRFTAVLQSSDAQMNQFGGQLADVSQLLDTNKTELATALSTMEGAFGDMNRFLAANRGSISETVRQTANTADTLARNRQALADVLQLAPGTLANFYNIYDPVSNSFAGALAPSNLGSPAQMVCSAIFNLGGPPEMCQAALGPLVNVATMSTLPVTQNVVQRPGATNQVDPPSNGPADPTSKRPPQSPLAGLLLPVLPGGAR